jgi:hypothetical protein
LTARPTTLGAFVVASVATFIVTLDNLVVTTALPVIRAAIGTASGGFSREPR